VTASHGRPIRPCPVSIIKGAIAGCDAVHIGKKFGSSRRMSRRPSHATRMYVSAALRQSGTGEIRPKWQVPKQWRIVYRGSNQRSRIRVFVTAIGKP